MARKKGKAPKDKVKSEIGAVRKTGSHHLSVALVYPNTYHVAMSNLGFQTVYHLINAENQVVCERVLLPDESARKTDSISSVESGKALAQFDIIAFSIAFENDYPNILSILSLAGIPLLSSKRDAVRPLIVAGGVACLLNPEPLAAFIDCFLIGEAEAILPHFFKTLNPANDKQSQLRELARHVPGAYVPAFYRTDYHADGTIKSFEPRYNLAPQINRVYLANLNQTDTCSTLLSPHTTFADTYLIETGRGCPRGCRFCAAGFIYRPPRFRSRQQLQQNIKTGLALTTKIGLVGSAITDQPELDRICETAHTLHAEISFSSMRADALTPQLIETLRASGVRTATIAPDAGSERMRTVINKGLNEKQILSAVYALVAGGIPNLKLYFMVGLPTETMEDVESIVKLCKRIKHQFLQASRAQKHIGEITVSLNCFVPKPFTPFQWAAMDDTSTLKAKIKRVKAGLKSVANLRVHADVPRWAYVQALLARGDRRVADILVQVFQNQGNWSQSLKASPLNADFYVLRQRDPKEMLPWDYLNHGVSKSFLKKEYQRALRAKESATCPMIDCERCQVCRQSTHL